MFAIRLLTAAALLTAFLAALFGLDRGPFALLVAAVLALGAREWAQLTGVRAALVWVYAAGCALLFGCAAWRLWPLAPSAPALAAVFAAVALFWIAIAPLWLARGVGAGRPWLLRGAGLVVLVPAALAMVALEPVELLLLLALVWIADTAAYLTGRALGRRKLAPAISPGKTWEGAAGALACVLAYAIGCVVLIPGLAAHVRGIAWLAYLGGATLLWAVSIVGDLFESALKRQAGVKDSGRLLPGHGGILDRIDSATAVLPIGALLLHGIRLT